MGVKKLLLQEFIKILDNMDDKLGGDVEKSFSCGAKIRLKIKKKLRLRLIKAG
jgi:hypothetical protein